MDGSKLCLARGEDGTGFYRFSVLGSAEDERCHAGPRFSPRHDLFSGFHKLPSDTDCPNATVVVRNNSVRCSQQKLKDALVRKNSIRTVQLCNQQSVANENSVRPASDAIPRRSEKR